MTDSFDPFPFPATLFDSWMKSATDFWSAASASDPPGMSSFDDITSVPETFFKMTSPVFSTVTQMIQQWQDALAAGKDSPTPFDFQTIDKQVLDIWKEFYDLGFRKFLNVPQLGLAREHQEKMAQFLDRLALLQSEMAQFLYYLSVPFKKAPADFQKKVTDLAVSGKPTQDANDFYRIWLKILEGHYMTLFQSPEYLLSLTKTLAASAAYTRAKKALVNDLLRQMSIPSSDQLDGVYHELHDLKRRLKNLEKTATHSL